MNILIAVVLVLLLIGGLPTWGYHHYGAWPSGGVGLILIVVLILWASGKL